MRCCLICKLPPPTPTPHQTVWVCHHYTCPSPLCMSVTIIQVRHHYTRADHSQGRRGEKTGPVLWITFFFFLNFSEPSSVQSPFQSSTETVPNPGGAVRLSWVWDLGVQDRLEIVALERVVLALLRVGWGPRGEFVLCCFRFFKLLFFPLCFEMLCLWLRIFFVLIF